MTKPHKNWITSMNLYDILETQLTQIPELINEEGKLQKWVVIHKAKKFDKELISLLLDNNVLKKEFFIKIKEVLVFNQYYFVRFLEQKNYFNNSYTQYKNKVGLTINGKYLKQHNEVALVWPFKDCVLEGGQSREEQKQEEVFFNEILNQKEITQLLDTKVLTNAKFFDKEGKHPCTGLSRNVEQNKKRSLSKDTLTDNLIIKGNNLLALHSIKKEFAGKVKLIYIDPPYNTGNDGFKYNDNFNRSTWLTFMKNRMEVARELLREDGVIFVSCDNHEFAHLKILMNEIFGDKNFLTLFTWETKKGSQGMITKHKVVNNHEYLIVFARNKDTFSFKGLERNEMNFTNPDNDRRGKWKRQYLQRFGQGFSQKTIINPQNGMKFTFETPYSKQKLETWIKDNRIIFPENSNKYPAKKEFLNEYKNREQLVSSLGLYSTKSNTEELYKLFDNEKIFRNPKPEKLLYFIIEQSTQVGDIVLDYHLGSGTTAAVAHKMGRKYIGIEQMNYIEDIVVERLKKVIEGEQGGISQSVNWQGGGSFVYFELKKYNQNFIEQIEKSKDTKTLLKVWKEMKKRSFLNYHVDITKQGNNIEEFKKLSFNKQKQHLCELLDKNQMYVNLSSLKDEDLGCTNEEKRITQDFYQCETLH